MQCPRCNSEVRERYACTNCGQVIGRRCLALRCRAINGLDAKFCGDCGYPMSPRDWPRFLGWYEKTIRHPRRNFVFFNTLLAALFAYAVPLAIANWQSGFADIRHELLSGHALYLILVAPPLVGIMGLWLTYPKGGWLATVLIGIFGEYFMLVIGVAIAVRLTSK